MADLNSQTVHTGNSISIRIKNYEVGRAQSLSAQRNYGTEGVYELGNYMPVEHDYLKYEGTLTLTRMRVKKDDLAKEHRRFEMSGNESKTGWSTVFNTAILNEFADLGIYNYTSYLFLDFHNGTPTIYLKYFLEDENLEYTFNGYTTTEIIFEVLELTIFSGKPERKRN